MENLFNYISNDDRLRILEMHQNATKRNYLNEQPVGSGSTGETNAPSTQRVDESSLNRIFQKHYNDGFIIITSWRGEKSIEQNNKDFNELKRIVKEHKFSFIPIFGGFIENIGTEDEREVREPSLLVTNHEIGSNKARQNDKELFNLGIELCNKYNQDVFLFKPIGEDLTSYYIDKNGEVDMTFYNKTINDLTKIYFTDLSKNVFSGIKDKTSKRFTFTESIYINNSPIDLNDAKKRYGEQFFNLNK